MVWIKCFMGPPWVLCPFLLLLSEFMYRQANSAQSSHTITPKGPEFRLGLVWSRNGWKMTLIFEESTTEISKQNQNQKPYSQKLFPPFFCEQDFISWCDSFCKARNFIQSLQEAFLKIAIELINGLITFGSLLWSKLRLWPSWIRASESPSC